jgi:dTDP-4-dehydrorhamnose 3,5-epimerase
MAAACPTLRETALPGCLRLDLFRHQDARGAFTKVFHQPAFRERGLPVDWREAFVTVSAKGVLRGMHFQTPPSDHGKLVACLAGRVLDVVLDLRLGSPAYGRCEALELAAERGEALFVPPGLAHGFLALEEGSTLLYQVTREHDPAHDTGVRWDSIPFQWPAASPLVSDRDRALPDLAGFRTPFRFGA